MNASGQVNIQDGFRVTAATFGSGDAGTINITAKGGVNLNGTNSRIQSTTFQAPDSQYNGFAQRIAAFFGVPVASFNYASLRTRLGDSTGPRRYPAGPCPAQRDERFGRQSLGVCH